MSWIAAIAELIAKWKVGDHWKWAHLIHLLAGGLWTYWAICQGGTALALLIVTVPASFLNIRNFWKWHNEESI